MKSLLKFTALFALIVGGRLSRTPEQAVAAQSKLAPIVQVVQVSKPAAKPASALSARRPESSGPQVLSVFFK